MGTFQVLNLAATYPAVVKHLDHYIKEAHIENQFFPFLSRVEGK
ncbi:MAG TPA: hypothetical protein VNI52_14590 [Sphingobacteriaceae bacterium]|nr:hypothetical protein [Sphingobacteriaceae bacterium]